MKLFLLLAIGCVLVVVTSSQGTSKDSSRLLSIFSTPPTPTPGYEPTTKVLENITASSTKDTLTFVNRDGKSCQCVPYYFCDSKNVGVDVKNARAANSQFGEFPWVVALIDSKNPSYVGAGVLINPEVVMTAAHVIYRYAPGDLLIRAGEWDTQTVNEIFSYEERAVREIYIHSSFNRKNLINDIALLHLERPVELTEHINVICMPEQNEVFDSHKKCVANGWGKNVFGLKGRYAVILKKVEVDMVPHSRCSTLLKRTRLGSKFNLHSSFVCAGGEEGKDTCQSDGGAPLVCPLGDNRYKLTGLVSWSIRCGLNNVPAAYTNVALFREWVDQKLEDWGLPVSSYTVMENN